MTTKPTIPEHFGRYRVLKELASGGMGTVFLAEDTQLGRKIALKVPHFPPGHDGTAVDRFYREARIAARIEHPNLCQVFDVGQINGVHYLTMPYVEGRPLSKILRAGDPWTPQMSAGMTRKVALALAFLHDQGVMHRDLKPSNVLVQVNGEPILIDFGLARMFDAEHSHLTEAGSQLGTPAYMSPEQVIGDPKAIGAATDIYSLGVILFELLTGQTPFHGRQHEIYGQILHATVPSPVEIRQGLDEQICGLCLKAMARMPGERFASMKAFAEALDDYLNQRPLPAVLLSGSGSGGIPAIPVSAPTPHPAAHPGAGAATPQALTPAPAEAASTLLTCGRCGRAVKVTANFQAQRLRCPWCQAPLSVGTPPPVRPQLPVAMPAPGKVPTLARSSASTVPPPLPAPPSVQPLTGPMSAPTRPLPVASLTPSDLDTEPQSNQPTTGSSPGGSNTKILLIVGLSLLAVSIVVVLLIVLLNREDNEEKKTGEPPPPRKPPAGPRLLLNGPAEIDLTVNQVNRINIPYTRENLTGGVSFRFEGFPLGVNPRSPLVPAQGTEAIVDIDVAASVKPLIADVKIHIIGDGAQDSRIVRLKVSEVVLPQTATNAVGMGLVLIKPGKFKMGSPEAESKHEAQEMQHEVTITRPYYIGAHEVTQGQFRQVLGRNPSHFKAADSSADNLPVEKVTWTDAEEFCRVLSALPKEKQAGRSYQLPTEAQWEYACRGGRDGEPTNVGATLGHDQANIDSQYPYGDVAPAAARGKTTPVGSFTSHRNAYGLFDMHGNVWEWCADWYERDYYAASPASDPQGPPQPAQQPGRVLRGGSWKEYGERCRTAYRSSAGPAQELNDVGFRVVMIQGPPQS